MIKKIFLFIQNDFLKSKVISFTGITIVGLGACVPSFTLLLTDTSTQYIHMYLQRHVILADKTKGTNFLYQGTMAFICKFVLVMYRVKVFCRFNTFGSSLV